jgi:hypothetical protein
MTHQTYATVFLFGSYDSRGGTTAVAAPDIAAAYLAYSEAIYLGERGLDERAQGEILDAEYLGSARLGGDLAGLVDGVDLDWDEGAVFARVTVQHGAGLEHEDRVEYGQDSAPVELLYVPTPRRDDDGRPLAPAGYWHPRWDDDEYGFVLVSRTCVSTKRAD